MTLFLRCSMWARYRSTGYAREGGAHRVVTFVTTVWMFRRSRLEFAGGAKITAAFAILMQRSELSGLVMGALAARYRLSTIYE